MNAIAPSRGCIVAPAKATFGVRKTRKTTEAANRPGVGNNREKGPWRRTEMRRRTARTRECEIRTTRKWPASSNSLFRIRVSWRK